MRQVVLLAGAFLLGCILITASPGRPTVADQPGMPVSGRYLLSGSGVGSVLVIDTATGQVWHTSNQSKGVWTDMGSPVKR